MHFYCIKYRDNSESHDQTSETAQSRLNISIARWDLQRCITVSCVMVKLGMPVLHCFSLVIARNLVHATRLWLSVCFVSLQQCHLNQTRGSASALVAYAVARRCCRIKLCAIISQSISKRLASCCSLRTILHQD